MATDPIEAFGAFLRRLRPVVLVESNVPYAEHLLADLLIERSIATGAVTIVGLLDGEKKSFREVGEDLGVTAEAARRLVKRAVDDLRDDAAKILVA